MLTHSEAQALISARLDAPLDDDIERILEDHLAGCDECRLFAASSNRLASALDALPTIPPSPAVRQAVWAGIEREPSVWNRIGGALSGQTAAVVSTAAIALLVIAFAALVIARLTGSDDGGDDERAQLAAGTQEGIALATESADPTETPAQPTEDVGSTDGEVPTGVGGATDELVATDASQSLPPTETTVATDAAPEVTPTPSSDTAPPAGPTEQPADLTGETSIAGSESADTSVAESESADTPVDLTGDDADAAESAEPTAGNEVVAAVLDATAESTATPLLTETPLPPTETPAPTDTPEPTETTEPTATPEPIPADLTVTVLDQEGEPVGNACFALIDGEETVAESCDTPERESPEFASNGNTGFFDVLPGEYTLRMTQQPEDVAGVEDQPVEIAPGSAETVTVSVTVATPTAAPTEPPAPTNTPEPTATQMPPTETPIPTEPPEPTEAPAPTNTQAPSPTSTPEPAESEQPTSPPIVPVDGQAIEAEGYEETPDEAETAAGPPDQIISPTDATASAGSSTEGMGSAEEQTEAAESQVIEPAGGQPGSTPVPEDESSIMIENDEPEPAEETEPPVIEGAETPEAEPTAATGMGSAGFDLSEANFYSDGELWGDANSRLAFVDGQVAFTDYPDSISLEHEFLTAQIAPGTDQQVIEVCGDGECADATQDDDAEGATDTPIGWFGDQLLYQRVTADGGVELRMLFWDAGSESAISDDLLTVLDGTVTPMGRAFPTSGGMLVPTMEAWLLVTDGNATVVDGNPYGDIQLARTNFSEPYIAYAAGGQLIIAEQSSPGTAITTIPFGGVDFDISPDMDAVVVSTGNGIEIWSLDGQRIGASAGTLQTGSVLWLSSGIVFIDQTNNNIRLLDPAALTG